MCAENDTPTPWQSGGTLDVLRGLDSGRPRPAQPDRVPGRRRHRAAALLHHRDPDPIAICGWTGAAGLPLIAMLPERRLLRRTRPSVGPDGPDRDMRASRGQHDRRHGAGDPGRRQCRRRDAASDPRRRHVHRHRELERRLGDVVASTSTANAPLGSGTPEPTPPDRRDRADGRPDPLRAGRAVPVRRQPGAVGDAAPRCGQDHHDHRGRQRPHRGERQLHHRRPSAARLHHHLQLHVGAADGQHARLSARPAPSPTRRSSRSSTASCACIPPPRSTSSSTSTGTTATSTAPGSIRSPRPVARQPRPGPEPSCGPCRSVDCRWPASSGGAPADAERRRPQPDDDRARRPGLRCRPTRVVSRRPRRSRRSTSPPVIRGQHGRRPGGRRRQRSVCSSIATIDVVVDITGYFTEGSGTRLPAAPAGPPARHPGAASTILNPFTDGQSLTAARSSHPDRRERRCSARSQGHLGEPHGVEAAPLVRHRLPVRHSPGDLEREHHARRRP